MARTDKSLLTPEQAAGRVGVSRSLIYHWCQDRLLPHYRVGTSGRRGRILIDPADLEAFMGRCRVDRHPLLGDPE